MENFQNQHIDKFLGHSSFTGLEVMYVCFLANKTRKPFVLEQVFLNDPIYLKDHGEGFFSACCYLGLYDIIRNGKMINVIEYNQYLASQIKKKIYEVADNYDVKETQKKTTFYSWVTSLKKIEKYFQI